MKESQETEKKPKTPNDTFTGNIFIFHAFDVGDEIDLEGIKESQQVILRQLKLSKHFKNYHTPLAIDLPHPHTTTRFESCKIHSFGAISLTYKIPFTDTLENIREKLSEIDENYQEESVENVLSVYGKIKSHITKPKFFHTRSHYLVIQVDPKPKQIDVKTLKEKYSGIIASMVRFETETLSEYQKNEILEDAIGYFRGDLIVIDYESAFVYDKEYEEILEFFEFANIQELELRYFDWLLDQQLNLTYEEQTRKLPWSAYIPFTRTKWKGPIADLEKLRVDISVITERLENSIKVIGEAYFSELYSHLVEKMDLKSWRESINKKLAIISDMRSVFQHKVDAIREDTLSSLIIILIFIELVVGILHYVKP